MIKKCSVPLLLVFIIQCLVVAAAFVAVILVLSLQQQVDFQETLYSQLELRMERTRQNVLSPVLQEEALLNGLADEVALNTERRAILGDDVIALDTIRDFFNGGHNIMRYAPRTIYIAQFHRSSTTRVVYKGEDVPFYNLAVAQSAGDVILCRNSSYNLFGLPKVGMSYPMRNLTEDMAQTLVPFDSPASLFPILDLSQTDRVKREWSTVNVVYDLDSSSLIQAYVVSLAGSPRSSITNATDYTGHGIAILIDLNNLLPLVASSTFTPEGTTVLFENRKKTVLAGKVSFGHVDPVLRTPYTIPETPDNTLNKAFTEVDARCGANLHSQCNSTIFTMEDGNEEYIVTAVRIRTESRLDMFLMQYNKRSYFFSRFEKGLNRGIIIGVCAAVLVVLSSVLIWLAVVRPIRHLQEQMGHAADMRNQEAADAAEKQGGSILREMDALHISFVAMNDKLLQARPYLPQALLLTTDDEDEDDIEEDIDDDESQSRHSTYMRSNTSQHSSSQFSTTGSVVSVSKAGTTHKERLGSYMNHSSKSSHPSSNPQEGGLNATNVASSVVTRRVAMLMINTSGFHSVTQSMSAPETARLVASLVTAVEGAVRGERGIVDSFHGDHFTVSFNTARLVGTALRNAAVCALQVESAVRRQTPFKRVSMGLAGGRAMVGNMGNSSMMKLCALGPASGQATLLEMIAQANLSRLGVGTEGSGCLVTESVGYDVSNHVHSEFVGWAVVLKHSYNVGTTSSPTKGNPTDCFSVLRKQVEQMNDEWMYALDDGGAGGNASGTGCLWMELQNILKEAVLVGAEHMYKDGVANSTISTSHVTNESPKDFNRVKDSCENLAESAVSSLKSRLEMKGHGNNTEELRRESYCSSSIVHTHIASFSRNGSVATGTGSGSIGLGDSSVHPTSPPRSSGAVLRPSLVPSQVVDVGPMGQPGCATSSSTSKEERPHLRLNAAELSGEDFDRCSPKTETAGTPDISTPKDHRVSVSGAPFNLNESTGAVEGQQYASLSDPRHASLRGSLSVNLARLPFHKSVLDNSSIADESRRYSSKSGGVGVFSDDVVDSPFGRAYKTLTNEERFILTAYDAIVASTNHRELADVYRLSIFKM